MARHLIIVILVSLLYAQGVISAEDGKTAAPSNTDTRTTSELPIEKKTTKHSSTAPTTEAPTTEAPTTIEPTSTTEEPTTTTEKPTTTTEKPTTTSIPTNATTAKPTPVPPVFPNNVGTWSVVDHENNVTCIIVSGALQISVQHENKTVTVNVPKDAEAKGDCGEMLQDIALTWDINSSIAFKFVLNMNDTKSNLSSNHYALMEVIGVLQQKDNGTEETIPFSMDNLFAFQTVQNKSYKCEAFEGLKPREGAQGVELKLEHFKMEAFRSSFDTRFSSAVECSLDGYVADIVPIAVGASLAGLVAIVLVAYLIGRRRSRARGYQSV